MRARDPLNDADWTDFRGQWALQEGVSYLNHGSFGPSPRVVIEARERWYRELAANPMEFFTRRLDDALAQAREQLGRFVGTPGENLIFADNATLGMNIVALSVPLAAGDEVLLNDHEYGAVKRIWERRCTQSGARLIVQNIATPIESSDAVVEQMFAQASPRTKLLVVSHITSPTAVIFPIAAICRRARELGISVCVDGPHAIATVDVALDALDCDYYTASCHKWLCAPFGSGFLYVHPRKQAQIEPIVLSWGRAYPPDLSPAWHNEFTWIGTRDPSAFLAIPTAIEFIESIGLEAFRLRTHALAQYARQELSSRSGLSPLVPDDPRWYGPMLSLPLPRGEAAAIHERLWKAYRIEIPLVQWNDRLLIRPSCHVYTQRSELDALVGALRGINVL